MMEREEFMKEYDVTPRMPMQRVVPDVNLAELKLECLRLASKVCVDYEVLDLAKQYYAWVSGAPTEQKGGE